MIHGSLLCPSEQAGVQSRRLLVVNFLLTIFLINCFCFVVAMSELVHDVEAGYTLQI